MRKTVKMYQINLAKCRLKPSRYSEKAKLDPRKESGNMLKKLDAPTSDINTLKESPMSIFEQAAQAQTGVYIFDHNVPCGVAMSVNDYEKMVGENDRLLDEITELKASIRLNNASPELISDHKVRGDQALLEPTVDEDDGWE